MKVCVIGGGTGSSAVLNGLRKFPDLDIAVIVSMIDDGASNAVVRDEFGLLPFSDLRKSIISLSELPDNDKLRQLFTYRFSQGEGLKSHTLGNLMMIAASEFTESTQETIDYLRTIFRVKHQVIPATESDSRLVAKYSNGEIIRGEHYIDEPEIAEEAVITKAWLEPKAIANPIAIEAIRDADYIIIGPGDLYTTTLANILVEGISEELIKTNAKLIYIPSLMSKHGQTRGRTQKEILDILTKHTKRKFDYILVNRESIPDRVVKYYKDNGEHLIVEDLSNDDGEKIYADLVAEDIFKKDKGDDLVRSIVRHDSDSLGWELYKLMREKKVAS
jgi:uncharacterized cofD-like protein